MAHENACAEVHVKLSRISFLALASCLALACAPPSGLTVDLKTDYVASDQFAYVRTEVSGAAFTDALVAGTVTTVRARDGYLAGVRVAELPDIGPGTYFVRVSLLTSEDSVLASRVTELRLTTRYSMTTIVSRSCEGVVCPRSGAPLLTECNNGFCVDPTCSPETPDACAETRCASRAECESDPRALSECGSVECTDGVCLVSADSTLCASGERCGAVALTCSGPRDAGMPDSGPPDTGPPDTGPPDTGPPDAGPPDAAPTDAGPLAAPTDLTASADPGGISAMWTASVGASDYTVEISTDAAFTTPVATAAITDTSAILAATRAGRRYYVRVRAVAADGRISAWSDVANAITSIAAPGTPSVTVTIPGSVRSSTSGGWVLAPPSAGTWYYAQGHAASSCTGGAAISYRYQTEYIPGSTINGWTGWMGADAFMVRPNPGYGVRFWAQARCTGPDASSSASGTGTGCRMRSGASC